MQNDHTTVATNDNEFDLDDLLLTAAQESDIKAGQRTGFAYATLTVGGNNSLY